MILTVPMWGSEVANSKTDIHLTNMSLDVTLTSTPSWMGVNVGDDDGG